ncbi:MAG: restriction endonuclease subunit S [Rikenellaceae bacterium]
MSENKDIKTALPKLRFPEFIGKNAWPIKSLGDIAKFYKGKGLPKNKISIDGNYPCVHYGELFTTYQEVINSIINRTDTTDCFLSKQNDVLMPTSDVTPNGLAKASCINLNDIYLGGDIMVIRFKSTNINGEFIARYIRKEENNILRLVSGTTVCHLYSSSMEKFELYIPLIDEQTKIAECLSSLDDAISGVSDKIEALKEYKKGLMQQLFPAEGKTTPAFRFPEFKGACEWEEVTLDSVCELVRGPFGGALKKDIFTQSGYAVYEQAHAIYGNFCKFRYFINQEKYNELIRFSVKPNDIIMSCSGTMGKFAIIPNGSNEGVINQALLKLSVKKGCNVIFIKALLELNSTQNQLLSQSAGGAIKNVVSVSEIKKIKLKVPSLANPLISNAEQTIIANCLMSLDNLIESETNQLKQLKEHKKGLMQQLFPTLNE